MTIKLLFDKPAFAKKSFQKFVIHYQGQPFISINSKMNHADYQLIFYLKLFKSLLFSSKILKIFLNFLWFCPFLKKFEGAWRFIDNWYTKFPIPTVKFSHCENRTIYVLQSCKRANKFRPEPEN